MTSRTGATPKCAVDDCINDADVLVFLEDFNPAYGGDGRFCERDRTCRVLCDSCQRKNEADATGSGRCMRYPFTKGGPRPGTAGWTTYQRIDNPDVSVPLDPTRGVIEPVVLQPNRIQRFVNGSDYVALRDAD